MYILIIIVVLLFSYLLLCINEYNYIQCIFFISGNTIITSGVCLLFLSIKNKKASSLIERRKNYKRRVNHIHEAKETPKWNPTWARCLKKSKS